MSDAAVYLGDGYRIEGLFGGGGGVELLLIRQLLQSVALEDLLHLAEYHFYGVVVGGVGQVPDELDVEVAARFQGVRTGVDAEVVRVDGQGRASVHVPEPVQELDVFELVEGLPLKRKAFYADALRDGGADRDVPAAHLGLVDGDVFVLAAPLQLLHAQLGEDHLVEEDELAAERFPRV